MNAFLDTRDEDVQVWPAYTDVALNIVLVLLVYLFAQAVISSQTSAALLMIQQKQEALKREILAALPPPLRSNVTLREDGNLLRCSFSDRVLFDVGKAELKAEGERTLGLVGDVLRRNLESYSHIQVEGHTDNIPINTTEFKSNWELSSARATSVVRFLQDHSGVDPARLSSTGYSEYHPVDPSDSDDGRARNRRIEMVVVYSTIESVK